MQRARPSWAPLAVGLFLAVVFLLPVHMDWDFRSHVASTEILHEKVWEVETLGSALVWGDLLHIQESLTKLTAALGMLTSLAAAALTHLAIRLGPPGHSRLTRK